MLPFISHSGGNTAWVPSPEFSVEGSTHEETLIFIAGISYALTYSDKMLVHFGKENYYCLPDGQIASSKLLLGLLNNRLHGDHPSKTIMTVITYELSSNFPCQTEQHSSD